MIWRCREQELDLTGRGEIMGILNATPDSFSDGGAYVDVDRAIEHALKMVSEGAGIIDIGGESTRPGAAPVDVDEECSRVLPIIQRLAPEAEEQDFLISVDTSKATVAREACALGAHIVNDVTGLRFDPEIASVAAEIGAGVVIMHMQGEPRTMQRNPHYEDVLDDVRTFFQTQLAFALEAGIPEDHIVFDPGIGFGKTLEHNLALLANIDKLSVSGRPLLVGVSRKSMFAKLLGADVDERLSGATAVTALTRQLGAKLHRVHDVRPNLDALRTAEALLAHRI